MATLTFLGAAGTVTGSRFVLEAHGRRLLVDCGLFQGPKDLRRLNWEPFAVEPSSIDAVLLTHAHLDHAGLLPRLCREGFTGPIHCTRPTADLSSILLRDSAFLQEEDARWANKRGYSKHHPALPLYTVKDAEHALEQFAPLNYGDRLDLGDGLSATFRDAGHILGSAFVRLRVRRGDEVRRIVFTGDLGRPDRPILKDPTQVFEADYVVLESTYGDRLHGAEDAESELAEVINDSVARGGVLVIPSFAVGRTQSLLYAIRALEDQRRIPSLPVYVDSPMAIDATEIFDRHPADQDLSARVERLAGKNIFHPKSVEFCRTVDQSKAINQREREAIIISASGMLTGGRVLHHLVRRLPQTQHTIVLAGYQAEGTRGRALVEGRARLRIHGQDVPVRARVQSLSGYSGHADYREMMAWMQGFNRQPALTFLVHGEPAARDALKDRITDTFGWNVATPGLGDSFEIDF